MYYRLYNLLNAFNILVLSRKRVYKIDDNLNDGVKVEKKKVENPCPLKPSEWIQFIINDQNQITTRYFSEELSFFTEVLITLTITYIALAFGTLAFIAFDVRDINFAFLYLFAIALFIFFQTRIIKKFRNKIQEVKIGMDNLIDMGDRIIEDIIDGKLKDTKEIREKYRETQEKVNF